MQKKFSNLKSQCCESLLGLFLKASPIKLKADKTKFGSKLAHLRFQQEM